MARGALPDSHELNMGMPGMHGTVAAVGTLQKSDLIVALGTRFEQKVWKALRAIPAGETRSYGQVAALVSSTVNASRAVGLANGANPIAIIVPCHRVIGSSGTLTGYAGGLERKRWLLEHERVWQDVLPAR